MMHNLILLLLTSTMCAAAHLRGLAGSSPVTGLELVIASTGATVELRQGSVIDLADLGLSSPDFTIQAMVDEDNVSSVKFNLDSGYQRTEGAAPVRLLLLSPYSTDSTLSLYLVLSFSTNSLRYAVTSVVSPTLAAMSWPWVSIPSPPLPLITERSSRRRLLFSSPSLILPIKSTNPYK